MVHITLGAVMRIGACDICNAQNVEIAHGYVSGIETFYCASGFGLCGPDAQPRPCKNSGNVETFEDGSCLRCFAHSGEACRDGPLTAGAVDWEACPDENPDAFQRRPKKEPKR